MQTVEVYSTEDIPDVYKFQVLAFQRIVWTEGFVGKNQNRDWITCEDDHPLHFLMTSKKKVICHAQVVWKILEHRAIQYKVYGLTGVMTFPDYRRQGYGKAVVQNATEYIRKSDGDMAMFHCGDENVMFYEACGWELLKNAPVTQIGDPQNPDETEDRNMFALFLSTKGKKNRSAFLKYPVYFGDSTW